MYVRMPNNYVIFLNNGISKYEDRLNEVNKHILDNDKFKWQDYFGTAWLREQIIAGQRINMTKTILDKCGTYLIMGQFKDSSVLTLDKASRIRQKEIPISCASPSVHDYVYGGDSHDEGEIFSRANVSTALNTDEPVKDELSMNADELEKVYTSVKTKKKRWKQSKTHRLNKLFSTRAINTYKVKQVFTTDTTTGKKVPLKTLDGLPVFDYEYVTIGNRQGLVGLDEEYTSQWCIVDTNNNFDYMGETYRISDMVEQYNVDWDDDNRASMDRILCMYLPRREKIFFFDQNIEPIDDRFITIL